MNYRVVWRRRAKKEIADVWLNAADRNEVTAAAHRIEITLGRDPSTAGESGMAASEFFSTVRCQPSTKPMHKTERSSS